MFASLWGTRCSDAGAVPRFSLEELVAASIFVVPGQSEAHHRGRGRGDANSRFPVKLVK